MKIQTVMEFELTSICPLKMDRWVDEPAPKNEEGYKKLAEKKVYLNSKNYISIPTNAIKASMRLASSEIGKKLDAKKNRQTIQSAVFFDEEFLSLGKKKPDMITKDIVTRGMGDKVTRVATYRPLIKSWKVKGKINLFGVPEDFAKDCLELAGFRFGLLSHRPEFGRFTLSKWRKLK